MPYTKTNWVNAPSAATPLSAANLNNLETQYDRAIADTLHITGDTMTGPLVINSGAVATALSVSTSGFWEYPVALFRSGVTGIDDMLFRFERYNTSINMKNWDIAINHTSFRFRGSTDNYSTAYDWLAAYRVGGSNAVEHVDILASSYVAHGSPNTFVNNLYVQAGYVRNRTSAPVYELWSDNSAGNHQRWQWHASANVMGLRAINDAGGAGGNDIVFTRATEQITTTQFRRSGVSFFTLNHTTSAVYHAGAFEPQIIRMRGYQPHIRWFDTSEGTERKGWDVYSLFGTLSIRTVNDNENSHGPNRIDLMRSGNRLASMEFYKDGGIKGAFHIDACQFMGADHFGVPSLGPSFVNLNQQNTGLGFSTSEGMANLYSYGMPGVSAQTWAGEATCVIHHNIIFRTYEPTGSAPGARVARKAVRASNNVIIGYLSLTSS